MVTVATAEVPAFQLFGRPHLVVIALTVLVPVGLAVLARRAGSPAMARGVARALGVVLVVNELVHYAYSAFWVGGDYFIQEALPLHVCDLGLYLIVLALWTGRRWAYEIAYYWGLAGTLQAIVTPELVQGFPSYPFVRFFITHGGTVTAVLFATWGLRMRPRARSVLVALAVSNAAAVVVGAINWALGTNYMYLCATPDTANPLFFAPWPWYILCMEPVALALFAALYLPFPVADWLRKRRDAAAGRALREAEGQGPDDGC